jgi:SAM-dependent methyltransferase
MPGDTWTEYYEENEGREPRDLLLEVLGRFPTPGRAVDLGCGAGIDAAAMLERGWSVFATDKEQEAIDRLRARVGDAPNLRAVRSSMEDLELPEADLVWASFSLFFCDPGRFADVWAEIEGALGPGGRFAGQLLGDRDSWAGEPDMSSFRREEAEALFDGWAVERFEEEDEDGEACSGPKHWHVFHVVARRPDVGPA